MKVLKIRLLALSLCAALMLCSCADSASEKQDSSSQPQSESVTSQTTSSVTASSTTSVSTTASTTTSTTTTTTPTSTTPPTVTAPVPPSADRTNPTVIYGGSTTYHALGTPFDLNKYVSYGDDTDRHPRLTYTGKVDTDKQGDYPIKATVTDSSGNSTSWDITVKVVSSLPSSPSEPIPSMTFEEFTSKYKSANTRVGIDVSQWQGEIDFNAVKNAGCSFVFIRVGTKFSGFTLDPYFKKNLDGALAAGLDVGVYLYTTDLTEASARESAKWVVSQLGGKKLTLPVAFDWEELDSFQSFGASFADLNAAYIAFKNELAQNGCSAMIYGSDFTLGKLWSDPVKNTSPIWLAQYTDKPTYKGDFGVWQVCYGRIAGIGGNTDFNVLYTDKKYK